MAASVINSMPKPGSMVSILSHSSRVMRLTSRSGRPAPTRTACARLSTRWQMRSSRRAPRPLLSKLSQSTGQASLPDVAPDRFRRADGLGEGAAHLDQLLRTDGLDRFGGMAGRLVKSTAELRTPKRSAEGARGCAARTSRRCARSRAPESSNKIGRGAQGGDRKGSDIAGGLAPARTRSRAER